MYAPASIVHIDQMIIHISMAAMTSTAHRGKISLCAYIENAECKNLNETDLYCAYWRVIEQVAQKHDTVTE